MQKNRKIIRAISCMIVVISGLNESAGWGTQKSDPDSLRRQVRSYRMSHEKTILEESIRLLSIPNVSGDRDQIQKNAGMISQMLQRRGVQTRLLEVDGSPPYIYGELESPGARRTIALYAHYDGQPVDVDQWADPPWNPVVRDKPVEEGGRKIDWDRVEGPMNGEWRIYARSAGDDKLPILAVLFALDALKAANLSPSVNIKFFFEGEEEAGSTHLKAIMREYAATLKADVWLLCDGPVHQTRRMQVYFGARGVLGLEMTVYGPLRALHSGHYGNWAPNPAMSLAALLASMRDEDGNIRIAGFYDDVRPLTQTERVALAGIPEVETNLRHSLGLARTEGSGLSLSELIMRPAMNLRGLASGHVGSGAANAIPTEACASVDFRLVPDQTPENVRARVEEHIRGQGYTIVASAPDIDTRRMRGRIVRLQWGEGYPAARTSLDLPVSKAVVQAFEDAAGAPVIKMPSLGGSVPMYLFVDELKAPVIGLPLANHDNNQHAANENVRLQNLWNGIEIFAGLLASLGSTF